MKRFLVKTPEQLRHVLTFGVDGTDLGENLATVWSANRRTNEGQGKESPWDGAVTVCFESVGKARKCTVRRKTAGGEKIICTAAYNPALRYCGSQMVRVEE